jgi:hypothetical protein
MGMMLLATIAASGIAAGAETAAAASTSMMGAAPPSRLRCEHAAAPLIGLDVPLPRFAWTLPDTGAPSVAPAAHELQVWAEGLGCPCPIWGSGKVVSGALSTRYAGSELAPDSSFGWRVRYWLGDTRSGWSVPYSFRTAPSAESWRNASWIDGGRGALRRRVSLPVGATVREAYVFASSIGFHHVLVDGAVLGNQSTFLFEPGQSVYSERALYTSYNITAEAAGKGVFTVGALLGNGPCSACGRSGPCTARAPSPSDWQGSCTSYISYSPGDATCCKRGVQNSRAFRALISVGFEMPGGGTETLVVPTAAGTWATAQSPNIFDDLYTGEVWDGRIAHDLKVSGFWAGSPVPSGLTSAAALRDNGGVNHSAIMSAQLLPAIGIRASYTPVSVTKVASFLDIGDANCLPGVQCVPGVGHNDSKATSGWVFKFAQSMAGVAMLRIKRSDFNGPTRCQWRNNSSPNATMSSVLAPYGCVVLRYGNILEDDKTVMNQFGPITYDQSDVFILGPSQDEQTYQVHFSYHGLTYIWLSGLPSDANPPPLSMLTAHKTNSAVADTGAVTTDHEVLNWIVHAARMSVTDVLQSIGMDVPDRERLGWLGDVSQYSEAAMRMLDTSAFFENQLRNEVDQAAVSGGWLPAIAPCPFHWGATDPAWVSALPGIAQHLYQESGDPAIFRRTYAAIKTQVDDYVAKADSLPSLLLHTGGYGDYINLACTCKIYGGSTKAGIIHDTGIGCNALVGDDHYFMRALGGMVQMAEVLNDTEALAKFTAVQQQKRQTFSLHYTGTNNTELGTETAPPAGLQAPPQLPAGHSWVSFQLEDEAIYMRFSCSNGYGSTLPKHEVDLADMTFDMQPALNGEAGAFSLSVWELQGGYPACHKYGTECPYFVAATAGGSLGVSNNDGSAAFNASASFTFTEASGEIKDHNGGALFVAQNKPGGCDPSGALVGDLEVVATGKAPAKSSTWKKIAPLLNSTPAFPGPPPPAPPPPPPSPGSLKSLTTSNQTQSLLSLVATSKALSAHMTQLAMVSMLNDLMSSDKNCILTSGNHPDGMQYGCFVQRAHFTGGMEGFKATLEALHEHERVDELYETLASDTWPGFGFMMAQGSAGVLWESWGVAPPLNAGICKVDQACISAGWLGGVAKYWFTVFGGIEQAEGSVGYQHPSLKPLVPMRMGGLDRVDAKMQVPAGVLRSSWTRHSATHLAANFSVPPGSGAGTLGLPTLNISSPSVMESGALVFQGGKLLEPAAAKVGLASARFVTAGSSVALEFTVSGSGTWAFEVTGSAPTTATSVSAKAGTTADLRCSSGMRIVNVPRVIYGGGGCSSGGAQFLVERLCLLRQACDVAVDDAEFDPTDYACRGVPTAERVLTVTVECAAP